MLASRLARLRVAALAATALWLVADGRFPERPTAPPTRVQSTLERMTLPRLAVVHADIAALARQRRPLEPFPGLHDYRAVCHTHAEDSTHTGGTRAELLADAHLAGVAIVLLTDHLRPPRDFMESWRGLHEGVLFIPGSEARGLLVHPQRSVMASLDRPLPEFIREVTADGGLAFLSHLEERMDHSMEGLDGLEIYNRHWDAKRDFTSLVALAIKLTSPREVATLTEALRRFPDETLAAQIDYPADYLEKWDAETPRRRLTGLAANDAHHNQVFIAKMVDDSTVALGTIVDPDDKLRRISALVRPSIRELTRGHQPGDILVRLDFDPYARSFRSVSTHLLAAELGEAAVRDALRAGHAYVAFDWLGDPTGFRFEAHAASASAPALMGDELPWSDGIRLRARFPLPCRRIRLLRQGTQVALTRGYDLDFTPTEPGVYRVEGWLRVDGEERCWILSNPIYLRSPAAVAQRPATTQRPG